MIPSTDPFVSVNRNLAVRFFVRGFYAEKDNGKREWKTENWTILCLVQQEMAP